MVTFLNPDNSVKTYSCVTFRDNRKDYHKDMLKNSRNIKIGEKHYAVSNNIYGWINGKTEIKKC